MCVCDFYLAKEEFYLCVCFIIFIELFMLNNFQKSKKKIITLIKISHGPCVKMTAFLKCRKIPLFQYLAVFH